MSNWLETTFGASTASAIMWIVLAVLVLVVLLVVLRVSGVPLDAVLDELAGRTGRSGLEEKASRPPA